MSLNYFFNPISVAIIGASNNPLKLGRQILDNIVTGGFSGKIYPINLKEKKIAGLLSYADLNGLPKKEAKHMLVVIAIPPQFVVAEVKKCGELGFKNIIIITAGFKETGEAGKKLEDEIIILAQKYKLNILGPNCLGLINTWCKLNATFAAADKETGSCALLSQSGAIGSASLDWLRIKDFNFGYFISLGNQAVIDENEIFEYLLVDKHIDLVVAYLEEIKDGQRFMKIVSRLVKKKPVAILKAGTSAAGGQLAMSHTGSLVGSIAAVKSGVERAGAIWLENLEELFNLLVIFRKDSWHSRGPQDLYVITNAGGLSVLTVDEISRLNVPFGRSLDILGDADAIKYEEAVLKMLADKKVNNLLVLLTPQTSTECLKTAEAIIAATKKYPRKLVITSFVGGKKILAARELFAKNGVATFEYPEEAVRSFKKLITYKDSLKKLRPYNPPPDKAKKKVDSNDYLKSLNLLKEYKLSVAKTVIYSVNKLSSYKYPVVLKAVGPNFLHKTDKGGVIANLKNESDLSNAASQLIKNNKSFFENSENYLVVQNQVGNFQEIILGFKRDASFGPLLMIGWGGIYTEILKDFNLAISDINEIGARELIKQLKIFSVFNGARGQEKYDIKSIARALVNLARLANEHPEISELDINPLLVTKKEAIVVDVRLILK